MTTEQLSYNILNGIWMISKDIMLNMWAWGSHHTYTLLLIGIIFLLYQMKRSA